MTRVGCCQAQCFGASSKSLATFRQSRRSTAATLQSHPRTGLRTSRSATTARACAVSGGSAERAPPRVGSGPHARGCLGQTLGRGRRTRSSPRVSSASRLAANGLKTRRVDQRADRGGGDELAHRGDLETRVPVDRRQPALFADVVVLAEHGTVSRSRQRRWRQARRSRSASSARTDRRRGHSPRVQADRRPTRRGNPSRDRLRRAIAIRGVSVSASPGSVVSAVAVCNDVTNRREAL